MPLDARPLEDLDHDLLVLPLRGPASPAWTEAFGPALEASLADARASKEAALVARPPQGPRRVAVVDVPLPGPGVSASEAWRLAGAAGARLARTLRAPSVALALPPAEAAEAAAALAEGFALGAYRYERYLSETSLPEASVWTGPEGAEASGLEEAVERAEAGALAACRARDLVNLSPDEKTPERLAALMREGAEAVGLGVEVWDRARIEAEGMRGLLAVNRGSQDPPAFVVIEHAPPGTSSDAPIVLVGKAVTFDTGGLSLKPTKDSMDRMKADMAGGAAVYGAMLGAARLGLPVRIVALIPMTDNRPGERAFVPGDVVRMHSGATVEVLNTDAEGRMLLADALSYARRYAPRLVVSVATLTGAQVVALGSRVAAVVTPRGEGEAERVRAFVEAGEETGEFVAPLPLYPFYRELLRSPIADLANVGGGEAGTLTAAAFLAHFTREDAEAPNHGSANAEAPFHPDPAPRDTPAYPWVHLDIAGPSFIMKGFGYRPEGATGFGVRLLLGALGRLG